MSDTLKPCPFCGGEGFIHSTRTGFHVECHNDDECYVLPISHTYSEESEAIAAWNRRAS